MKKGIAWLKWPKHLPQGWRLTLSFVASIVGFGTAVLVKALRGSGAWAPIIGLIVLTLDVVLVAALAHGVAARYPSVQDTAPVQWPDEAAIARWRRTRVERREKSGS